MKTTTTFKAMMAIAFAMFAMTANANTDPKGNNTWRNPNPHVRYEVRYDNRDHRHYEADWRHCHHTYIDRYGNRTFCHFCGSEMVWRGGRNGHYEVIPPRPMAPVRHHGGAPVPPPPAHGHHHR